MSSHHRICEFQSALPRGERHTIFSPVDRVLIFQSALPRGERHFDLRNLQQTCEFQSALPRGERLLLQQITDHQRNFNPRSHEGSDSKRKRTAMRSTISIRAPTRGATSKTLIKGIRKLYFNPRSHEGSDHYHTFGTPMFKISIRAPTRGATRAFVFRHRLLLLISIRAPTRGATFHLRFP